MFRVGFSIYRSLVILSSRLPFDRKLIAEKTFLQHGIISVYRHSVSVALLSLYIAEKLRLNVDKPSLVRGALLHDYFLYDWHERNGGHRWHGFIHAERALANAVRDFSLNPIERDIIRKHMFPLNITLPRYRESYIVTCADKIVAVYETFFRRSLL